VPAVCSLCRPRRPRPHTRRHLRRAVRRSASRRAPLRPRPACCGLWRLTSMQAWPDGWHKWSSRWTGPRRTRRSIALLDARGRARSRERRLSTSAGAGRQARGHLGDRERARRIGVNCVRRTDAGRGSQRLRAAAFSQATL
jgi:hypothetical protein